MAMVVMYDDDDDDDSAPRATEAPSALGGAPARAVGYSMFQCADVGIGSSPVGLAVRAERIEVELARVPGRS